MKSKKPNKPLLFVIPAVLMLLTGFGILVRCSVGERLDAAHALMIPLGFATAAINPFSPGLRTPLSPLMRTNLEKQFLSNGQPLAPTPMRSLLPFTPSAPEHSAPSRRNPASPQTPLNP